MATGDNIHQTAYDYLRALNITASKRYISELILSHPDYPSLLSITDTLEALGIKHAVLRAGPQSLSDYPYPYLLYANNSGELSIVQNDREVRLYRTQLRSSDGLILFAEPNQRIASGENEAYLEEEKVSKYSSVVIIASFLLIALLLLNNFTLAHLALCVTAVAGAFLSYLILARDLGITNRSAEILCEVSDGISCDHVLNSKEATIIRNFKISDAAAGYFAFQCIAIGLAAPLLDSYTSLIAFLSCLGALAIPVVIYTLYIQVYRLKTWCRLCMLVSMNLLCQSGVFIWVHVSGAVTFADLRVDTASALLLLLVVSNSIVLLVKHQHTYISRTSQTMFAANRVKRSPSVFMYMLSLERTIDDTPFDSEVQIGTPNAGIRIIIAASLDCPLCENTIEKAWQLVRLYPTTVDVSLRFVPKSSSCHGSDSARYVMQYLLEALCGRQHASTRIVELLREWYDIGDFERFRLKYPMPANEKEDEAGRLVAQHARWFERCGIRRTPSCFVMGHQMPKNYSLSDMNVVIPGLTERLLLADAKGEHNSDHDRDLVSAGVIQARTGLGAVSRS